MIYNQRTKVSRAARLVSAAVVWILGPSAYAEEAWQPVASADREGVTLERRAVPGSKFFEYRAQAVTTASPEAVLHGIFSGVTDQLPPTVKQRKVLRSGATEILFYDQLKTPVVSDRDYTIRMVWKRVGESGVIEVPFGTMNELGPPPAPGYVRVPTIRGLWIVTPAGEALTRISYLCYSDPGGSIPAFMARGAQQAQVLMDMHRILVRAKAAAPAASVPGAASADPPPGRVSSLAAWPANHADPH